MPPIQAHYGRTYFHPGPPLAMGMISHWLPSARLGPFVAFQLLGGAVWLRLGGFRLWLQCGRCFVPSCQLLTKSRTGCTHTHTGPPSPNQMRKVPPTTASSQLLLLFTCNEPDYALQPVQPDRALNFSSNMLMSPAPLLTLSILL